MKDISEIGIQAAVKATDLTRYYGLKPGVRDLDLTVPTGTILGLLGENGSGKTTALKLMMGNLLPDRGAVTTLGVDPAFMPPETRARIGWLSDRLAVPDRLTLADAMRLQAAYFPTWNQEVAYDLAMKFMLTDDTVFGQISLGQKRRFMLILVLAQMPDLLVLDEPASGLDTAVRRQFIDILIEHATARPMTIVLSSHILSDVERLVDHVAFMKDGHVTTQGELETLRARVKRLCLSTTLQEPVIRKHFNVIQTDQTAGTWRAVVDDFNPDRLTQIPAEITVEHLNLEELFIMYNSLEDDQLNALSRSSINSNEIPTT